MYVDHIDVYILQVLDGILMLGAGDADVVELVFHRFAHHADKGVGGTGQAALLAGIEGQQTVRRTLLARFHLGENQSIATLGDDVDFVMPRVPVVFDDGGSLGRVEVAGDFFAPSA